MRIIMLSDSPTESGFGRIANEVGKRLVAAGHNLMAVSVNYSGHPHNMPFWCWRLAGDIWQEATGIINQHAPDMVLAIQDFPYAQTLLRSCRIDWSRVALFNITPIDGTPINPEWLDVVDDCSGTMVISRFGVEAMRQAGRRVGLCHPGVDTGHFKPATADEKRALRERAGIAPGAFVLGMAAMNQGRKNIPATLEGFAEFAKDKPDARLLLDMERVSGAGWNIPVLAGIVGLRDEQIIYREDLLKRGLTSLRDRFCLMDAHSVISFREGFGLPLLESMACRVPSIALDWCSGTELVGDGKGVLIPTAGHARYGTWGNAQDRDPDMRAYVAALRRLHAEPAWAALVAETGYKWAIEQTWDKAAQAVMDELPAAMERHAAKWEGTHSEFTSAIGQHRDPGLQPVAVRAEVPDGDQRAHGSGSNGDHPGGRRQPGIQPAGPDPAAGAGLAQLRE